MLFRGKINGKRHITANIAELAGCDDIEVKFLGSILWQVW
jgi:hypothetical protein